MQDFSEHLNFTKELAFNSGKILSKYFGNVQSIHKKSTSIDLVTNADIESENLDLLYASNLVSLYNIKKAVYGESSLKVDKINFDILTKDLSMNMYKNNERINILYK